MSYICWPTDGAAVITLLLNLSHSLYLIPFMSADGGHASFVIILMRIHETTSEISLSDSLSLACLLARPLCGQFLMTCSSREYSPSHSGSVGQCLNTQAGKQDVCRVWISQIGAAQRHKVRMLQFSWHRGSSSLSGSGWPHSVHYRL